MDHRLLAALLLVTACHHASPSPETPIARAPKADDARVEIHVEYHATPGPEHGVQVTLEGTEIPLALVERHDEEGITVGDEAIRVHPGVSHWTIAAGFFRSDTRSMMTDVPREERYPCPYGFGVMCKRTIHEQRMMPQTVRIPLGECGATFAHTPRARGWYRLEYDFLGDKQCALRCWKHMEKSGQPPHLVPCRPLGEEG